jgi:hypothetical protein
VGDETQPHAERQERSKDIWSRRTASMLPLGSGIPPSPPHTGQAPLSASGVPIWLNDFIFAASTLRSVLPAYCWPRLVRSAQIFRPLPPILWFPRGPGRASLRRVLRVRCPSPSIGNLSTYPSREACRGSGVAHRVIYPRSCHALLNPYDLRAGSGSLSMQMNSLYGSSSPNALWGIVVREAVSISSRYGFLPPP